MKKRSKLLGLVFVVLACFSCAAMMWFISDRKNENLVVIQQGISLHELSVMWQHARIEERKYYLDAILKESNVLSQSWIIHPVDSYAPNPERSIIWGMTRDQVVDVLGKPDYVTPWNISYDIGVIHKSSILKDAVDGMIGIGVTTRTLSIYFDKKSGGVVSIYIES